MAEDKSALSPRTDEEDAGDKKKVASTLDSVATWDAKHVDVDKRMLDGRKANRGFTMSCGSTTKDVDIAALRGAKRAQTLPAMSNRRGDAAYSEVAIAKLAEANKTLQSRARRGSASLALSVIPKEELENCWKANTTCHVHGKMTEGQTHGDERQWEWFPAGTSKLPGDNPPIVACQKGSKGFKDTTPNQDNFSLTYYNNGYILACTFDGHGAYGHIVSTRTVQTVPYFLAKSEHWPSAPDKALIEAFENAQKDVVADALQNSWDVQASGSTAVAALWKDNVVYTANAGDSRCAIGSESSKEVIFETADHKPNTPAEQKRIEASGGECRSQTYSDGWVNHRIYVKGEDYPGLCMARTLGDQSVKEHGVIATPEVARTEVDFKTKPFFILASDGVWEFMDSPFVVKAVAKKIQSDGAEKTLQKLQREAKKRWKQEEGDYCDDITSMLVQLGPR